MNILDFKPKGDLLTTVAVGAAVVAVPVVIPLAWSAARPLLKAVFKGGLMIYETGRGAYAAAADWTGPKTEKATAVKPKKTEARGKEREERALAQNLGLVEEQSRATKPARPKPRRAPKPAGKITEPRT